MLRHHHRHAIKQTLGAVLLVFLVSAGLFLTLRPNLFSRASQAQTYTPPTDRIFLPLPEIDEDAATTPEVSNEKGSKAKSNYFVQPPGLPLFKVTSVMDGDTLILEGISRVKLAGIKAPNTDEDFGIEAGEYLKSLVDQKEVYFQVDDKNSQDELGRLRAIVYVDGRNVNIEMLRAGLAYIFPNTPSIVGYDDWTYFWNEAREAKRGIWSGEKPRAKEKGVPML